MFMLTHTYFLQKLVGAEGKNLEPDSYVYNIAPDLLAIHPGISSAQTHTLLRSLPLNPSYPKSAYVIIHLLVDDISHYGYVCSSEHDEFDIHSKGYAYIKGISLIESIVALYRNIGREVSYADAVYQSHLIIEMIYDLIIMREINALNTIDVLVDSIRYTAGRKMDEFIDTMHWLYGIQKADIRDVVKSALDHITKESMQGLMNLEGRINLYRDKFSLQGNKPLFYEGLKDVFEQAMDVIDDEEIFFQETADIIRKHSTFPLIK